MYKLEKNVREHSKTIDCQTKVRKSLDKDIDNFFKLLNKNDYEQAIGKNYDNIIKIIKKSASSEIIINDLNSLIEKKYELILLNKQGHEHKYEKKFNEFKDKIENHIQPNNRSGSLLHLLKSFKKRFTITHNTKSKGSPIQNFGNDIKSTEKSKEKNLKTNNSVSGMANEQSGNNLSLEKCRTKEIVQNKEQKEEKVSIKPKLPKLCSSFNNVVIPTSKNTINRKNENQPTLLPNKVTVGVDNNNLTISSK